MSFLQMIDALLLKPLELLFETAYRMAYKLTESSGLSIIMLSLVVNILLLPLYMRADAIQKKENETQEKLEKGVAHIKKTFKGDERMMMLRTYYAQNHYKPVYALRSAVSLLLQIPFFIAAYRYLSTLVLLFGIPFGPIPNLGEPDGMLQIGGMIINVLPFIMTAINLVSCIIFTKGKPFKSGLQLYAMALFFLIFLYNSPSGLVFYWTLNNVFSLAKTCFYKIISPKKAADITQKELSAQGNKRMFFSGALFWSILTGILIPSSVIAASPQEFVDITYWMHPFWYIVNSFCLALGLFVIWGGVFYSLARPVVRGYFEKAIWLLSGVFIANYMFFGKNLGLLTPDLIYENGLHFGRSEQLLNIGILFIVIVLFYIVYKYWGRLTSDILTIGVIALLCMSAVNMKTIQTGISGLTNRDLNRYEAIPEFTFSKTGSNVVVLMLDRGIGAFIPYIFEEKPQLKEQFSGFTYYTNVVSFGKKTNFGTPALFGGYEYTPVEMNKRTDDLLQVKHDEALKVMPVLFSENGYRVTVCDPPYAGYNWLNDLSIYDEYPGIECYNLDGKFTEDPNKKLQRDHNKRNFFYYGILKTAPLFLQKTIYDNGNYNMTDKIFGMLDQTQIVDDNLLLAEGTTVYFQNAYNVLEHLDSITSFTEDETGLFLMTANDTTHSPLILQEPDYVPSMYVDNTDYDRGYQGRYDADGNFLKLKNYTQLSHYHCDMAAMLQLGKWFDYLRENGIYDNTKIILVADHGEYLELGEEYLVEGGDEIQQYYPILMVKDFNSTEFETSEEFMTNADVPALAVEDAIEKPINPFTGKSIHNEEKTAHDQYLIASEIADLTKNNGTTYLPSKWYAVHDDMRNPANWKLLSEKETVLPVTEE